METIPWYKSAIIRQQIVQLIVAGLALAGITTDVDWSQTVELLFGGIAAAVAVWTVITRLFKPAPNLTATATAKEQELIAKGTLPKKQAGFAMPSVLYCLFAGALVAVFLSACAGTKAAYRAADNLPDRAFVIAEHYAVLVREAADIAQNPATPQSVREALKVADQHAKPFIVGDSARGLPSLKELADAYQATRTAQTEAELQAALNNAVVAVAGFIRAVKAARGEHVRSTHTGPRWSSQCGASARTEWPAEDLGRAVCVG